MHLLALQIALLLKVRYYSLNVVIVNTWLKFLVSVIYTNSVSVHFSISRYFSLWATEQDTGIDDARPEISFSCCFDWRYTCASWLPWKQVFGYRLKNNYLDGTASQLLLEFKLLILWWLRSPIADPKAKGVVCGLTLDTSEKQLALLYLATVQSIAYGTRHIVDHCNAHGHQVRILTSLVMLQYVIGFFFLMGRAREYFKKETPTMCPKVYNGRLKVPLKE